MEKWREGEEERKRRGEEGERESVECLGVGGCDRKDGCMLNSFAEKQRSLNGATRLVGQGFRIC